MPVEVLSFKQVMSLYSLCSMHMEKLGTLRTRWLPWLMDNVTDTVLQISMSLYVRSTR